MRQRDHCHCEHRESLQVYYHLSELSHSPWAGDLKYKGMHLLKKKADLHYIGHCSVEVVYKAVIELQCNGLWAV